MDITGFEQEHLARRALMFRPPTVELLNPLLGNAHQIAVMPMRVVGVAPEMRAQRLDAGVGILGQVDPVVSGHAAPEKRVAELLNAGVEGGD
ncbi:hypothetical protein D3C87_1920150 [compost metagenome]